MLRLRSDEQLVALYRAGHEEAFRVIHDRYRQRLFAYTRQMLPGSRQDAEDALQDIFIRAYAGLRASDRQLALRAWLYRVAHNRCIDELRRPSLPPAELIALVRPPIHDPIAQAERRESLRRLIEDVRRLPGQQRSALLMRELGGMPYADLAAALGVSVPAVKSLLVRARIGLAQSGEARDTACGEIRNELIVAHDRGVRPSGMAKRHLRDCAGCREFRGQVRGTSRQLAALVPLGPLGLLANLFGFGGGAASGSAAGGGAAGTSVAGTVAGTGGAVASIGAVAGGAATHVATLIAAAVVTAGGAVEIQRSVSPTPPRSVSHAIAVQPGSSAAAGPSANALAAAQTSPSTSGAASANPPRGTAATAPARAASGDSTAGPGVPQVDQISPISSTTGTSPPAGANWASTPGGTPGSSPLGPNSGSPNGQPTTTGTPVSGAGTSGTPGTTSGASSSTSKGTMIGVGSSTSTLVSGATGTGSPPSETSGASSSGASGSSTSSGAAAVPAAESSSH